MAKPSNQQHTAENYDVEHIAFLEALWGDGYMSPGGPAEVARLLSGTDLAGKAVLDIGCGTGGIAVSLVADYGAASVIGVDVEASVCAAATARVERSGLQGRVEIQRVEPGPLPFADGSFDVVFSKDSIVHIADKTALAATVFSVLKPGGWFVASDWMASHDGQPSPEMAHYLALEDLGFGMASPDAYRAALDGAGFCNVAFENRNEWYRTVARDELAQLSGAGRHRFEAVLGTDEVAAQINTWQAMIVVLDTGEHCPHHLKAQRPSDPDRGDRSARKGSL